MHFQNKIISGAYTNIGGLRNDVELLFSNAATYNMAGSVIYEDACALLVSDGYIWISDKNLENGGRTF